jgi:hypothetical protein
MSKVLCVFSGGIGNIVQAMPALQSIIAEDNEVDVSLYCNSSNDMEIFKLPGVRRLCVNSLPNEQYDFQLIGPFSPSLEEKAKKVIRSRIRLAQHSPEANLYYDMAQQMGVTTPMPFTKIVLPKDGRHPTDTNTVAIYPGSKPNWAMKRWNKYDELAKYFDNVVVVGSRSDIYSQGNPTWIKRKWRWPNNVEFFIGSLAGAAFLISKCKMFVGNDGGLSHCAAATGVPTFILFGPSSTVKNKPYAPNAHVIAIDLSCRPCQFQKGPDGKQIFNSGKASCPFNMKCMKDMSVQFVLNKIRQINSRLL